MLYSTRPAGTSKKLEYSCDRLCLSVVLSLCWHCHAERVQSSDSDMMIVKQDTITNIHCKQPSVVEEQYAQLLKDY